MPIYEYRCDKCGIFEVTQRITESPLKRCPTCKGKVERIISHTSFILKGSGWYATDYGRSGSPSKGEPAATDTASTKPTTSADGAAHSSESKASTDSKSGTDSKPGAEKNAPGKSAD